MALSARIDELKKKFDENPRRYFAPLANEYRKAGDLEQAIAICRAYLPQQPAHMSGHIVFGQALFEAGEYTEAKGVFETALGLDPENLIALRHLGDIARVNGDVESARAWYRRVLDADPRNEEIAEQLAALDGAVGAPAAAPEPASGSVGWSDVNPERAGSASATTSGAVELGFAPEREDEGPSAAAASARDTGIEKSQEIELSVPEAAPPPAQTAPAPAVPSANSSAEQPAGEIGLEVMEFVPPSSSAVDAQSGLQTGYDAMLGGEAPAPAPGAKSGSAATFATETMAELYLQQGYTKEALEIYRELLQQSPHDDALRERVRQLESGARSSLSVAAVSDDVIADAQRRQATASRRTIRSFLARFAARRPPRRTTPVDIAALSGQDEHDTAETVSPSSTSSVSDASAEVQYEEPEPYELTMYEPPAEEAEEFAPEPESSTEPASASPDLPYLVEPEPTPTRTAAVEAQDDVLPFPPRRPTPVASANPAGVEAARSATPSGLTPARGAPTIDALFGGADVPDEDEQAAHTLSGAYRAIEAAAPPPPPPPPTSTRGQPTREAATELSLDHVFRDSGEARGEPERRADFSFDQFFAEAEAPEPEAAPAAEQPAPDEGPSPDDVQQFNSWLQGLKKK